MMTRTFKLSALTLIFALTFVLALAAAPGFGGKGGTIAVADRASGTLSLISTKTDSVYDTVPLPAGTNTPEPMYVVYSPIKRRVFVGDRANDRIVVFSGKDFSVETTVPAGAGVFHMWASARSGQLWVNNDVDKTTSVIDLKTLDTLATIPSPADLVDMGGKPHDVILDPRGRHGYISFVGITGNSDYVVQFCTRTFQETARAAVGKDPHLSLNWWNRNLYVPCQGNDAIFILKKKDLSLVKEVAVPGAHGAAMSRNGLFFYTTNISGGGTDAVYTLNTFTNTLVGDAPDAPFDTPHNIALTRNSRKVYVTHSGANNSVSVFTTRGFFDPAPEFSTSVTVGDNPFGLAFVP